MCNCAGMPLVVPRHLVQVTRLVSLSLIRVGDSRLRLRLFAAIRLFYHYLPCLARLLLNFSRKRLPLSLRTSRRAMEHKVSVRTEKVERART